MKKPDGLYLPIHNIATLILAKNLLYAFNIYYGSYHSKEESNKCFLDIEEKIKNKKSLHQSNEFNGLLIHFFLQKPSVVATYEFETDVIELAIKRGRFLPINSINELFSILSGMSDATVVELPTIAE